MPVLLTAKDVAGLLGTSPKHVYNLTERGQFPRGRKVPGLGLRWARAVVQQWLDAAVGGAPA